MRILVVDDEPAVREAVERALRLGGHDVALAADSGQALDALDAWPPDAVVLGVLIPRVDGLDACRRMQQRGPGVGADTDRCGFRQLRRGSYFPSFSGAAPAFRAGGAERGAAGVAS